MQPTFRANGEVYEGEQPCIGNVIIRFAEGTLPNCPEGATLVEYLASLLNCKRSRVYTRLYNYDRKQLDLEPFSRKGALSYAHRAELYRIEVLFQESLGGATWPSLLFPPTGL